MSAAGDVTITVVGSGPSLAGRGLGAAIDAGPVIRLHNWHWQGAADHGTRCDWAVLPGPWGRRAIDQVRRPPATGWLRYVLPGQSKPKGGPASLMGLPVTRFDASEVPELVEVVSPGRAATRGLMMAVMAIEILGARRLRCAGLDAVLTGVWSGYSPELPAPAWWTPGQSVSSDPRKGDRENFRREAVAIAALAARRGVELEAL